MDRIERHDVINSVALAAVLLVMAFGLVWGVRALRGTAGDAIDTETGTSEPTSGDNGEGTTTTTTQDPTTTASTIGQTRPAGEVTVRVGNGARRAGIAGRGTALLQQVGYATLSQTDAPSTETSKVYFVAGYQADALQVASILAISSDEVRPVPAEPEIPLDTANVLVILGADTTVQ